MSDPPRDGDGRDRASQAHAAPPATGSRGDHLRLQTPSSGTFDIDLRDQLPRGHGQDDKPPKNRWLRARELANNPLWHYRPGAFFLGYRNGDVIGRQDDRHILLVAGSRAGKGVSIIIPNCLLWPGSVLAIDPKGELADLTAGQRKQGLGQEVHVLDPIGATAKVRTGQRRSANFNPLWEINPSEPDAAEKAALIADGLIVSDSKGDSHWTDAAKQLLHGLVLHTLSRPEADRNLVTVRECLTLRHPDTKPDPDEKPPEGGRLPPLDEPLYEMLVECKHPIFGELVRGIGQSFLAKPEKERGSILSTAAVQTAFLDSPALASTLTESDFALRDLKRGRVTVYLCLPAGYMGTHARWLRIIINMALAAMEDGSIERPADPVLMVLEEFNVLGHMASIATAAGQIAGFGVRLLTVLQDLTQLQRHYSNAWETFIGNSGLFIAFGNSDVTTLEYISKKIGTISIQTTSITDQTIGASVAGATGISTSWRTDPLATPHELEQAFARERVRALVMFPGAKPIILRRSIAHDDPNFKPLIGR